MSYKGYYFSKKINKWKTNVWVPSKQRFIGTIHDSLIECIKERNYIAKKYNNEDLPLEIPIETKNGSMTHGELWIRKKMSVYEKELYHFENEDFYCGKRNTRENKVHYALKLRAVWGLLNMYETLEENFAAVEIYNIYCKLDGRKNTLQKEGEKDENNIESDTTQRNNGTN